MAHQREEEKGAIHVERTVGKIQHTQNTKDQRQAGGNQVDSHGNRHTVQKLDEEVRHPVPLRDLRDTRARGEQLFPPQFRFCASWRICSTSSLVWRTSSPSARTTSRMRLNG